MQLLADVTGLPCHDPGLEPDPRTGAALCGALAAGSVEGVASTTSKLQSASSAPAMSRRYEPSTQHRETYDEIYSVFCALHDAFGEDHVEWLHHLKQIRRTALASTS